MAPVVTPKKEISVERKLINIQTLMGNSYVFRKRQITLDRKAQNEKDRRDQENQLERGKPTLGLISSVIGNIKGNKATNVIQNFLLYTFLGAILTNLKSFLPTLKKISDFLPTLGKWIDTLQKTIVDPIIGFIDRGYKAYDWVNKKIEDIGGKDAKKKFEKFSKDFNLLINGVIIAAGIILATSFKYRRLPRRLRTPRPPKTPNRVTLGHDTHPALDRTPMPLKERIRISKLNEAFGNLLSGKSTFRERFRLWRRGRIGTSWLFSPPNLKGKLPGQFNNGFTWFDKLIGHKPPPPTPPLPRGPTNLDRARVVPDRFRTGTGVPKITTSGGVPPVGATRVRPSIGSKLLKAMNRGYDKWLAPLWQKIRTVKVPPAVMGALRPIFMWVKRVLIFLEMNRLWWEIKPFIDKGDYWSAAKILAAEALGWVAFLLLAALSVKIGVLITGAGAGFTGPLGFAVGAALMYAAAVTSDALANELRILMGVPRQVGTISALGKTIQSLQNQTKKLKGILGGDDKDQEINEITPSPTSNNFNLNIKDSFSRTEPLFLKDMETYYNFDKSFSSNIFDDSSDFDIDWETLQFTPEYKIIHERINYVQPIYQNR